MAHTHPIWTDRLLREGHGKTGKRADNQRDGRDALQLVVDIPKTLAALRSSVGRGCGPAGSFDMPEPSAT